MTVSPASTVIMDNGSSTTKIGFSGSLQPHTEILTAVGTKRDLTLHKKLLDGTSFLVGDHSTVLRNSSTHSFNYMIRNGIIQDWDALERLWHSCIYDHLRCNPEDHPFLLSESVFSGSGSREKMAEIMFETFNVPALYICSQPILSLVSSWGRADSSLDLLSGTVVDSGENTTSVIPVSHGRVIRSEIQQMKVGGRDVTNVVQQALRNNKRGVSPSSSHEVARQIKEKYGYVCSNPEKEKDRVVVDNVSGRLPNGKAWDCAIDEEKFLAGEVLFDPSLANVKVPTSPIPNLVDFTLQKCPIDCRRALYGNIVLSGGTTMFPGFGRRLQRDMMRIVTSRLDANKSVNVQSEHKGSIIDINVATHSGQKYAVWLGGSIVASNPRFLTMCKTREQYEEYGPSVFRQSAQFNDRGGY